MESEELRVILIAGFNRKARHWTTSSVRSQVFFGGELGNLWSFAHVILKPDDAWRLTMTSFDRALASALRLPWPLRSESELNGWATAQGTRRDAE
jgi:hypothetical protein